MPDTRRGFHDELEALQRELLEMGELAGDAVQHAVHAVVLRDSNEAQGVIDGDDEIDGRYLDIDQRIAADCSRSRRRSRPISGSCRRSSTAEPPPRADRATRRSTSPRCTC